MDDANDIDLSSYSPDSKTKKLINDADILLLVGPSGSGKDTLARELLKTGKYHYIITHTTRAPRHNHGVIEENGVEYHFVSVAKAKKMLANEDFLEAAIIHGNLYGTSVAEIEKANKNSKVALTDIDVQGVRSYKKLSDNNAMAVFLLPPSFEVLLQRVAKRYGHAHDDQEIKTRLTTALDELDELLGSDYYHTVINDDLEHTIRTVAQIVSDKKYDNEEDNKARKQAKTLIKDIKKYLADKS
jgi:guanylate kinase